MSVMRRVTLGLLGVLVVVASQVTSAQAHSAQNDKVAPMGASKNEKARQRAASLTTSTVTPPIITAECPPTIRCIVVPAAYQVNNGDVVDYGNYDVANRPHSIEIDSIVVHDGEGTCQQIIDAFQNPRHYASTQYVVCRDGTVFQMVRNQDVPWHAGNWWYNMHSIGIEHEGHAAYGSTDYTLQMYLASAELVKYLVALFGISPENIIGHDNVPAPRAVALAGMHTDPGPYWNWGLYMLLITGRPTLPSWSLTSEQIKIAPLWPLHKPVVTGCSEGDNGCVPEKPQPANFVYLRTESRLDAPLFVDPVLGPGTTDIKNNNARLFWGQTFMVADRRVGDAGVWYKVWVNGATGWFHSPWNAPTTARAESTEYVTPQAGQASAPVYGRPSPELSVYPAELLASPPGSFWIPRLAPTDPLPYHMQAGQKYRLITKMVANDHLYTWTIDGSYPYEGTVFRGQTLYYQIEYGGRIGFVKASDVDVSVTRR